MSNVEREAHSVPVEVNDAVRPDGLDAVCLTVEWPNYKMLWSLRCDNPAVTFAVLQLSPAILWRLRCCFSVTNAADASVSHIPVAQRSGYAGFMSMFDDYGAETRIQTDVRDHLPTNPQAEVSVLESIPPSYVIGIWLTDAAAAAQLRQQYPNVHLDGTYHWPRHDHQHW